MTSASKGIYSKFYFIYILKCANNTLYVGSTNNLHRRISEHKNNKGGSYTKVHPVLNLIYYEKFKDKKSALKREKQLKRWSRAKKEALISGNTILLKKLSVSSN